MNSHFPLTAKGLPDWPRIIEQFPFMTALEACPQDPLWHGEGNVRIHTEMVCTALSELRKYQELPSEDRAILMVAAIFHDCAKPDVTQLIDGRWRAPNHSRKGMEKLRYHWWETGTGPDIATRELILDLIRYHGLPVHFMERSSPESAVIEHSQTGRNDLLALIAEADNLGRINADPDDHEQTIQGTRMFSELATEHRCLNGPWLFPNTHARFDHFRRRDHNIHYMAHDDREGRVTILSGLPGAGKDSWVADHAAERPVVSLDVLRAELEIDPTDNQGEVIQAAFERAKGHLRKKEPFIWNATNVTQQMRRKLYDLATDYRFAIDLVWIDADRPTVQARNRQRKSTQVPMNVIERLARKTEFPNLTEAHSFSIVDNTEAEAGSGSKR